MKTEVFHFTSHAGMEMPAILWLPEEAPRLVLQLTHGMTEYTECYQSLAEYLTPLGIAVAGFDLRGHGNHGGNQAVASFGEGGWDAAIEDMRCFYLLLRERFPGCGHYLHGFSLGSFLLREYLGKYPGGIDGALIIGTGQQPRWLLRMMQGIVKGQIRKVGFDGYSPLVRKLSFGVYNQKFQPTRTEKDWLCSDDAQLAQFQASPLARENFSAGLFWQMLGAMERQSAKDACRNWDKDMPILLLYGEMDPVGNFGKGVQAFYDQMIAAGMKHVQFQQFLNARHQILREEACGAADQARHAIADWLLG